MKIMMLHARYLTRGGEDESTDAEVELLRSRGHEVDLIESWNRQPAHLADAVGMAGRSIYSFDAKRRIAKLLEAGKYDVLHVQNFFPSFSPSVYGAARRRSIPVVQAVRNYRLVCASANLFRNGSFCNQCVGRSVGYPAVLHKCYRGSSGASAAIVAMQSVHRALGTWRNAVDTYLPLTNYVHDALVQGGFPQELLMVKPNFVPDPKLGTASPRKGMIFVGRLTEEKGLPLLIKALQSRRPAFPVHIVGEGPLAEDLYSLGDERVVMHGRLSHPETLKLMAQSKALILPISWPEPFGRVVIEAFSVGTPVVAAPLGGVRELVTHGETGYFISTGSADSLSNTISMVENQSSLDYSVLSANCRSTYESLYTPDINYRLLMSAYARATKNAYLRKKIAS